MMGPRQVDQAALFYEFSLERHVPVTHLLRSIDRFVDLSEVRSHLAPFYSSTGRPSIDPELLVRMLLVGYCYGIRSERRLCEEVHLNLAYRWFCRLGLDGEVPDHSTFSKNRHGRFRDCDLLRKLFETVVRRCMAEGLAYSLLNSPSCFSLPRYGSRIGLHIFLFEACSTFTRVAACTLALSPIRDTLIEGFSHFVTSMTAPIASGWSRCRVGLAPTGKRRLFTAHANSGLIRSPRRRGQTRLPARRGRVSWRSSLGTRSGHSGHGADE